jgi:hypothetical protein
VTFSFRVHVFPIQVIEDPVYDDLQSCFICGLQTATLSQITAICFSVDLKSLPCSPTSTLQVQVTATEVQNRFQMIIDHILDDSYLDSICLWSSIRCIDFVSRL